MAVEEANVYDFDWLYIVVCCFCFSPLSLYVHHVREIITFHKIKWPIHTRKQAPAVAAACNQMSTDDTLVNEMKNYRKIINFQWRMDKSKKKIASSLLNFFFFLCVTRCWIATVVLFVFHLRNLRKGDAIFQWIDFKFIRFSRCEKRGGEVNYVIEDEGKEKEKN